MALTSQYLIDKSALVRLKYDQSEWARRLILDGVVATCSIIDLKILYSARDTSDFRTIEDERATAFESVDIVQQDFDRAIQVMGELAQHGNHRAVGIPDLIISALAERSGLIVVHYDHDFDIVAEVTGQTMQWLAPAGSLP